MNEKYLRGLIALYEINHALCGNDSKVYKSFPELIRYFIDESYDHYKYVLTSMSPLEAVLMYESVISESQAGKQFAIYTGHWICHLDTDDVNKVLKTHSHLHVHLPENVKQDLCRYSKTKSAKR